MPFFREPLSINLRQGSYTWLPATCYTAGRDQCLCAEIRRFIMWQSRRNGQQQGRCGAPALQINRIPARPLGEWNMTLQIVEDTERQKLNIIRPIMTRINLLPAFLAMTINLKGTFFHWSNCTASSQRPSNIMEIIGSPIQWRRIRMRTNGSKWVIKACRTLSLYYRLSRKITKQSSAASKKTNKKKHQIPPRTNKTLINVK